LGQSADSRFLAIDDTILEHPYGMKIQGTGKYWDASKKRWIHGHNIVTSMAINNAEAEPIDIHVYLKEKDAELYNAVFRTKIDIACEIIRRRAKILNVIGVLFDSWYCCETVLQLCDELELHWYSELRANRIVFLPRNPDKFHVSEFARALPLEEFKNVELPDSWQKYKFMTERKVIIKGKQTKVRTIKLVILWDGKDNLESYKFLATNNLSATGIQVLEIHRLRWKIEEFHRDAKQNLGLADCMLRKYDGVVIHLLLVLLAYSALKRLLASTLKGIVNTIGECGRYLKRQFLERRYSDHTAIT
jgi:SRSO17 transposase